MPAIDNPTSLAEMLADENLSDEGLRQIAAIYLQHQREQGNTELDDELARIAGDRVKEKLGDDFVQKLIAKYHGERKMNQE